jgi:hypothetical protein
MSGKHPLTPEEISAIVDGFDPIDWDEMETLSKLSPGNESLSHYGKPKCFAPTFVIIDDGFSRTHIS